MVERVNEIWQLKPELEFRMKMLTRHSPLPFVRFATSGFFYSR
jgi:hypothetical protein